MQRSHSIWYKSSRLSHWITRIFFCMFYDRQHQNSKFHVLSFQFATSTQIAAVGTFQCTHTTDHSCAAAMFSKFLANFWILMTSSDQHEGDRVVQKESRLERSDHRRLLILSLIVMMLSHLWAPPGATGASPGSFKRRILGSNGGKSLAEWDDIFHQRSDEDWRVLWHNEKHRRCQHQLLSHMELVCEKDIYKLARRKRRKRDLAGGEFGSDDSAASDQQEDIDGGLADSENEPRFMASVFVPNVTSRPLMPELPKHPLFSTFKEANLFGRRQLFKTRKRQISAGHNSGNFIPIGTKRSSRLERSKGISDECCSGPDGCSWEEYAEYCPANVRVRIAN